MEESESIQSLQEEEQLLLEKLRKVRLRKEEITKSVLGKRPNPHYDPSEIPVKKKRPNRFPTYEKHPGTVNHGDEYQILMCILYALKLSINDDVIDFEMTANDNKYGFFRDIKLYVTFKNGNVTTFLFQLKHKDNENIITQNELFSKQGKGDISIAKCFESLSGSNVENYENTIFILYTNRPTNIQAGISSNDILVEDCLELDHKDLISNPQDQNSNSVHQFRSSKTNQTVYFFTKQRNITDTKNIIKDDLYHLLQCDIYNSLTQFMNEWWSGNFTLNKHDFIAKVTELAFSPYLKVLSANNSNEKTENLVKAIMDFELTIIKNDENDIVGNIWSNLKTFDKEEYVKTVEKFRLSSVQESNLNTTKILWHMSKVPLIVKVQDSNKESVIAVINFLRKSCEDKKIILIGNISRSNCNEWTVFENLSDLMKIKKNEAYCLDILKYFNISLQGRDSISIDKLLKIDKEFANNLETQHLLTMSQLDLVIGEKNKPLPHTHIPRNIIPHCIRTENVLKYCKQNIYNSLVIINCDKTFEVQWKHHTNINMVELSDYLNKENVQKNEKFVLLSTATKCTILDFEKVYGVSKKRNVHLFQVLDDQSCILLLNKGQPLQKESINIMNIKEEHVHQYFNNHFNLFCAPPGMGKTTMMNVLYNSTPSENWAVYVNLMKHNKFLSEKPTNETILNKLLEFETEPHSLVSQFKIIFLKEKKLHIYLDGLDEIDSSNVNFVISFMKYVSSQGINIWVSSRENLREKLSQDLSAIPIEIQELNEEQQENYIRNRLEKKFSVEKIDKIMNAIFNSSDINNSRDLLGIPLQLHIITEMFLTNDDAFKNLEKQNLFVLTQMYRLYFEGKKKTELNKLGLDEQIEYQLGINYKHILEQYEIPALRSCLDKEDYEKLQPEKTEQSFLEQIKEKGDKYGIIETVDENCETVFVHQTYAEYFACSWLKKNLGKAKLLQDQIFSKRYENLRLMFDIMLAENNPLHLAIIYKNIKQFEMNIQLYKDKDFGGRTALCLACMYGAKYSHTIQPDLFGTRPKYYSDLKRESRFYINIMKILFQQDVNIKDRDYLFDLDYIHYSLKSQCLFPIEMMLETQKLNFNEYKETIFEFYEPEMLSSYAAQFGYCNLFSQLRKLKRDQSQSETGELIKFSILGTRHDVYTIPRTGNITVVNILTQNHNGNLNSNSYDNILDFACQHGCYDVIETLIQNGVNYFDGNTILHSTAKYGTFTEIVIEIYQKVNKNQNLNDIHQKTALQCKSQIAEHRNIFDIPNNTLHKINRTTHTYEEAKNIIDVSLNINIRNERGQTALHLACEKGYYEIAKKLVENGADVNIHDNENNNTFHYVYIGTYEDHYDEPNEKLLNMLIDAGLDVNARNKSGQSPLYLACKSGSKEIVKKLIDKKADVNSLDNANNNAFYYALTSSRYSPKILSMLIDAGLDVNARNKRGQTALHLACERGYDEIVEKLIENGANTNALDDNNNNSFNYALRSHKPNQKLLNILIDEGIDRGLDENVRTKRRQTALHLACEKGYYEIAKKLIEHGADVNILDEDNNTTLHYALKAYSTNEKLLSMLIDTGLEVNARNIYGQTALHLACKQDNEKIAEKLIESGADVNIRDNECNNTCFYALRAYSTNEKLLSILIEAGLNVNDKNKRGQTALHLLCEEGYDKTAKKLIDKEADVNNLDNDNNNTLHYVSRAYIPNKILLSMLIDTGVDINAKNKNGKTALHLSCEQGYNEIAKKLIENGTDVNSLDKDNNNILHCALRANKPNQELLIMLIDAGLDVNAKNNYGQTALHLACEYGYTEIAKKLIEKGVDVNISDKNKNNTLHYTLKTYEPNQDLLNMLKNAHVDINACNKSGQTALHFACEKGWDKIAKKLMEYGADVNIVDNDNNNTLHYAFLEDTPNEVLLSMLIDAGVDVNAKNKSGRTALHLACEEGYNEIAKKLIEKGADVNSLDNESNNILHIASTTYRPNHIGTLIDDSRDINAQNSKGQTALHLACEKGRYEIAEKLIKKGADVNILDSDNNSTLHYAYRPNQKLLSILIDTGLNVNTRNKSGQTALHVACEKGYDEIAEKLMENGADVNILDNYNNNTLHYVSRGRRPNEKLLSMLIEARVDVNARNNSGQTALHLACEKGYDKIVNKLIENAGDINALDSDNNCVLHYASNCMTVNIIMLQNLVNFGLEVNTKNIRNETPSHLTCKAGILENFTELISREAKIDQVTSFKRNLLHYSAVSNNTDLLRKILNFGFQVNARDIYGASALHIACKHGNIEVIKELRCHGADIHAVNNKNMTALHYAALTKKNHKEIISYLLECEVDSQAKDEEGRNALIFALKKECYLIMQIFIENNIFSKTFNTGNVMFLYCSVYSGSKNGVKMFLDSYKNVADVDIYNKEFPLYFASKNGKLDAEIVQNMTEFIHDVIWRSKFWTEKYTRQGLIGYLEHQRRKSDIDFIFRETSDLYSRKLSNRCREIEKFLKEYNKQHNINTKTSFDSDDNF